VREVGNPSSAVGMRSALHSIIALGNEAGMGTNSSIGNTICILLAKEGCVKALLKHCNAGHQKCQDVRILALRCLSAICCVAECIREFELVIMQSSWLNHRQKVQNLEEEYFRIF
jgi:hypothetical protein